MNATVEESSSNIVDTGARPKDNTLKPCIETVEEDHVPSSVIDNEIATIEADLEPTILVNEDKDSATETTEKSVNSNEQQQQHYVEEAEYVDLDKITEDLEPQIGRPTDTVNDEVIAPVVDNDVDEGSPPPYSEVDPMTLARPSTLPLTSDTTEAVLGAPGATPSNPSGPRGQSDLLAGLSEDQLLLGKVQPFWVPDSDAPTCMICSAK